MQSADYDLIIIGGGAAGLAAAITSEPQKHGLKVALLEKNDRFGKKLCATGNGRANISNRKIPDHKETIAFFNSLGIYTRCDEKGRIYPFSENAPQLVETLTEKAGSVGCDLITMSCVQKIERISEGFLIHTEDHSYTCRHVIIAAGGKAGPMYGCSGDGYLLAKALGHQVTKTLPVLTGVRIVDMPDNLKGVRQKAKVTLYCFDKIKFSETGEVQFTDYGLSGICIFNLSRYLHFVGDEGLAPYRIELDLYWEPSDNFSQMMLDDWLMNGQFDENTIALSVVEGIFKRPLGGVVLDQAHIPTEALWKDLSVSQRKALIQTIHHLTFKPESTMGFKQAQCTAGGILWDEVDRETGASRLVHGLYFAGEILDYDGPCGGYNLDHAFNSGRAATQAAVKVLSKKGEVI